GERRHPDLLLEPRPQIQQRAIVVFMRVGDDDTSHLVQLAFDETGIWQHEIDSRKRCIREGHANVDDDPLARPRRTEAVEGEVHSDFAYAAQRAEDELVPVLVSHTGTFHVQTEAADATAPKCTSPAATVTTPPSCSRMTKRHSSSIVSKIPRTTRPSTFTATSEPRPAARFSQRWRMAERPLPASHIRSFSTQASESARNSVSASHFAPSAASDVAG